MILKASERGDAPQLARYLLAMRENDHVELHEVRGFASDDLLEAFQEAEAVAKGTRCKNHLFSMSLNPPQFAQASTEAFEMAAEAIEQRIGLEGHPRAIVFHEKDGRRHAHVVWSRIDAERMRAVNLSHFKRDLREISRNIFREQGWDMPAGLRDWRDRDPLCFSREEWQQAKRVGLQPKDVKALFKGCWERSDSPDAFAQALRDHGFMIAKGDRRGFVAVDYVGEVYSLSRYSGVREKEMRARLGKPDQLPSIAQAKTDIAQRMTGTIKEFIRQEELEARRGWNALEFRRSEMVGRQREERTEQREAQQQRWAREEKERAERMPRGFSGIWHRVTGRYSKVRDQNELEAWKAVLRDRAERDGLLADHLDERAALQREIDEKRRSQEADMLALRADIARYQEILGPQRADVEPEHDHDREGQERTRRMNRDFGYDR